MRKSDVSILFLGDSLTAGYGLRPEQSFPALIEREWRSSGLNVRCVNAGRSGDTTADGRARLAGWIQPAPDFVVVALGANDMLRGIPASRVRKNLAAILGEIRDSGSKPILLGMRAAPLYGWESAEEFDRVYPELAIEYGAPLMPFFIECVIGLAECNLPDGLHPNAEGHRRIAARVRAFLESLPELDVALGAARRDRSPDFWLSSASS